MDFLIFTPPRMVETLFLTGPATPTGKDLKGASEELALKNLIPSFGQTTLYAAGWVCPLT